MPANFVNTGADEALVKSLGVPISPNPVFTKTVCIAMLFNNDLHHIHTHAAGHQFDRIHNITQDLYYQMGDDVDTLAELALEYGQEVPNPSLAGNYVEWGASQQSTYNWDEATRELFDKLALFTSVLAVLRNQPELKPDAQSTLDDILRRWNKELDYKLERRMEA